MWWSRVGDRCDVCSISANLSSRCFDNIGSGLFCSSSYASSSLSVSSMYPNFYAIWKSCKGLNSVTLVEVFLLSLFEASVVSVSATWGMFDRILRPISNSLGARFHHGRGVALYDNCARKRSLASLSRFFTVFTPLSAWPLLWVRIVGIQLIRIAVHCRLRLFLVSHVLQILFSMPL